MIEVHKIDKLFFRDQLRNARNCAVDDAENFDKLLYVFERLGCALSGKLDTIAGYRSKIRELAGHSCLARKVPDKWKECHLRAARLLEIVRQGRNDALHQGAFARHLTARAIELSLVLEDALMTGAEKIGDYMVRGPVCAHLWQPISLIRQEMLAHSFSNLPVYMEETSAWKLVSDLVIAKYLRSGSDNDRKNRLAKSLQDAINQDDLKLLDVHCYQFDHRISDVVDTLSTSPILIYHKDHQKDLVGILTPFDLL